MRTALVSFIMVFGIAFDAFAQEDESRTQVIVLGLEAVHGDDSIASTTSTTLRAVADGFQGWSVDQGVNPTLPQMRLAHGCDMPDRACLTDIGETFRSQMPQAASIVFGRMSRRGAGSDDMVVDLALFDLERGHVTHRARIDARISDLILRGQLGERTPDWLRRLVSDESRYEDTGQPYFEPVVAPPPGNPHEALEIAGWSLVGVAAASLIGAVTSGGVLLGHNGDARYQAYRSSWDAMRVGNACDAAAADLSSEGRYALGVCNDASVHEILVPLFWTIGAVAGAAGALLAWHPWTASPEAPAVGILPVLGPTQGGLTVIGAF